MTFKNILRTLCLSGALLSACAGGEYASTNRAYKKQARKFSRVLKAYPLRDSFDVERKFIGTTNFGMRKPNYVIIHHTAQNSTQETLRTFTIPRTAVSAHYVIGRDGKVHHMLNDFFRAQHAGLGKWGTITDMNSCSIGIELDNNGMEEFSELQINALLGVLDKLKTAFGIPAANFIGHGDWAPGRKNDPNWRFPWKNLSENGFGLWYDDTTGVELPSTFSTRNALRLIGYNVKDSVAAIMSFKRHWLQDTTKGMLPESEKILYQLSRKY